VPDLRVGADMGGDDIVEERIVAPQC
jgi:hypothetical protein